MANLKLEARSRKPTRMNIIFIHGLGSNSKKCWENESKPPDFWIKWLAHDLHDVSVWTIQYEAAVSRWSKESAMSLADRALNILELLLASNELKGAEIALVGHSTGGLIIKQLMRTSNSMAESRVDAAEFQAQVRRVALIATPHLGTDQATFRDKFRIFMRPSLAAVELVRNEPLLRDLNLWYREWAVAKDVSHLILVENKATSWFWGVIAKPDTSDPGLSPRPILIDADHFSITKPSDRSNQIYILLKKFVEQVIANIHPDKAIQTVLQQQSKSLDQIVLGQVKMAQEVSESSKVLQEFYQRSQASLSPMVVALVDSQIEVRLNRLIKCRFFEEYNKVDESKKLAFDLVEGELATGSALVRSKTLAWCARFLVDAEHASNAKSVLSSARSLADCKEIQVAESILLRHDGHYGEALKGLSNQHDPLVYTAMFIIVQQEHGPAQALEWAEKSQLAFASLDGDGKFFWLHSLFSIEKWDDAHTLAANVLEIDFDQSPILFFTTALANLLVTVPNELRRDLCTYIPFELDTFPLKDDRNSLALRKRSAELFLLASKAAKDLSCHEFAKLASDFHLWLLLRDSDSKNAGLLLLKKSLDASDYPLRHLNFAFKFGLKLDFEAVEREIDKQEALTGGTSLDVALGKLVLTLNQSGPAEVLRYLDQCRAQLEGRIVPDLLDSIEIQALAASGQLEQATKRISELAANGISDETLIKYRRTIEVFASDEVGSATRIRQYQESGKFSDLVVLVEYLLQTKDWEHLVQYAGELFNRTNSISDAESLVIALESSRKLEELEQFLAINSEIVEKSDLLLSSWSWALFRAGRVAEASGILKNLLARRDNNRDRTLEVNVAIASGAWESLAEFAERQWIDRGKRNAEELMYAARIAQNVSAPRARDLMLAAIRAAPTNPEILMNGYILATESGEECDAEISSWLSKAVEYSGQDGPVRNISLEEIANLQPDWNLRAVETSKKVVSGEMPTFLAAKLLGTTLIDLVVANGILNIRKSDPRRRTFISAFSGARKLASVQGGSLAMDATAILTLGRLGLLDKLKSTFSNVSIPHSTLSLFFVERKKISFHQPSQIKRANFIRQLISQGVIAIAPETAQTNPDMISEVGNELAALLAEISMKRNEDKSGSYAVTSFPVHRAGSLREEEVNITEYLPILCDAGSVLRKLMRNAQITNIEYQFAQNYLQARGQLSCCEVELPDGASLYFDDLAFIHLYHTGILKYLGNSGLKIFVSSASITHVDALIERESSAPEQLELMRKIKKYLENGIANHEIALLPATNGFDTSDYDLISHPSFSILQDISNKDCILIDERYLNHHSHFDDSKCVKTPIITTLDLLAEWKKNSIISDDDYCHAMTTLRRACYIFVPIDNEELQRYFELADVKNGRLVENAELRAIREYLLCIRMSNAIKFPEEATWLQEVMHTFLNALKKQWLSNVTEEIASARSGWLWRQINALQWATVLPVDSVFANAVQQFKLQNLVLVLSFLNQTYRSVQEKYWRWLEREVLADLKNDHSEVYKEILEMCGKTIREIATRDYAVGADDEC